MNSITLLLNLIYFSFSVVNCGHYSQVLTNLEALGDCDAYEPTDYDHVHFVEVDKITNGFKRFDNNTIRLQVHILSRRDVNILLTPTNNGKKMDGYEIHVGVYWTYRTHRGISIDRFEPGEEYNRMALKEIPHLWRNGPRKIDVEIRNDGKISVFAEDKEIVSAVDSSLKDIKYVSFTGNVESFHLVFYNCTGLPKSSVVSKPSSVVSKPSSVVSKPTADLQISTARLESPKSDESTIILSTLLFIMVIACGVLVMLLLRPKIELWRSKPYMCHRVNMTGIYPSSQLNLAEDGELPNVC